MSGRSAPLAISAAVLRSHLGRPLLCDEVLRRRLLAVGRELHLRVDRCIRQCGQQRLRDDVALREVLEAGRVREPLEPDELPLVGVEKLLPQTRRPRMRGVRVDRLRVVRAVDAVRRDGRLPVRGRELGPVPEIEVVPVDDDRRLARRDRLLVRLDRDPVTGTLQLGEEVDPRSASRRWRAPRRTRLRPRSRTSGVSRSTQPGSCTRASRDPGTSSAGF